VTHHAIHALGQQNLNVLVAFPIKIGLWIQQKYAFAIAVTIRKMMI